MERIELNEEHLGRRFAIMAVILLAGAAFLAYGVMEFLSPPSGWQAIEANGTGEPSCAVEFTFLYEAGSSADAKAAAALYTDICQRAYRLFQSYEEYEGTVSVHTLNRRPNEALTVDPALYRALSTAAAEGRRELYLGPVYARYNDLFFCRDDAQLTDYDPRLSEAVAREYREILAYANDPASISLELLGENRVCLRVSEAYLDYAERMGIQRFIDFGWMRNAFIADLLAEELAAAGFTRGVLSSFDGFTRNLDGREGTYDYPLYSRRDGAVRFAANMRYGGPMSVVSLRDFASSEQDLQRFYTLRTGEVRTVYLDAADGLCRSAASNLVGYSRERGCAQVLMAMLPVYIADGLEREDLAALAVAGVQSICCQGAAVLYTDPALVLADLDAGCTAERTAP